jgi:hypothetical protein
MLAIIPTKKYYHYYIIYYKAYVKLLLMLILLLRFVVRLNSHFVFLKCAVYVLYCICNFVCCVLFLSVCCFVYCSTTATGYKPIWSEQQQQQQQ